MSSVNGGSGARGVLAGAVLSIVSAFANMAPLAGGCMQTQGPVLPNPYRYHLGANTSRYKPHQGAKECARRRAQRGTMLPHEQQQYGQYGEVA